MRRVLILCPTERERRSLPTIAATLGCEVLFEDFDWRLIDRFLLPDVPADAESLDVLALIESLVARYAHGGLAGVTSATAYPGMPLAAIVAQRLGLPGPRPESLLLCEQKYECRRAMRAIVPEATPAFHLVDPSTPEAAAEAVAYPAFLKPVKSCFSILAMPVHSRRQLLAAARRGALRPGYLRPLDDLVRAYTDFRHGTSGFIAESLLQGVQTTLEGFVYDGRVHVLGLGDAETYAGSGSFRRFRFPSTLGLDVRERMEGIATKFLRGIGYDHAAFNVEFMYDPASDALHVLEVNPKLASQFTDLFEKLHGTDAYAVLLALALGEEPRVRAGAGRFPIAASVALRTFEDARVERVPSALEIAALRSRHPDVRVEIAVGPGQRLSDIMQDGHSYRYAVLNLGARDAADLDTKTAECVSALPFRFAAA